MINQRVCFVSLLLLISLGISGGYAAPVDLAWWDFKLDNKHSVASHKRPNILALRWGRFPPVKQDNSAVCKGAKSNSAKAWIRSPDGAISEANLFMENGHRVLHFPSRLNPAGSNGLYVVVASVDAGLMDIDSDGTDEGVHYYTKYLICHRDEDGIQGKRPDVFFKDAEKIPLEIGSLDALSTGEEASYAEAGCQEARKRHKMKVLYKERPLADAEVALMTESGWVKRAKTDSNGMVSITPIENKEEEEKCLYVVTHKDLSTGRYFCSSLMMHMLKPPPSWMSKAGAFVFWALLCSGLFVVYGVWAIHRKKRRDDKDLAEFERHKIKRD